MYIQHRDSNEETVNCGNNDERWMNTANIEHYHVITERRVSDR
jgi:hypothetical protein